MNENVLQTVSFFSSTSYRFIVFFFYLHFCILCHLEIMMHCEISDRYFNVFVEIQMEQKNLKSVFWASEFGCPNLYTSLPNGLNTSLRVGPGQLVLCDSTFTCQEVVVCEFQSIWQMRYERITKYVNTSKYFAFFIGRAII